jgi:hypothetical protein
VFTHVREITKCLRDNINDLYLYLVCNSLISVKIRNRTIISVDPMAAVAVPQPGPPAPQRT